VTHAICGTQYILSAQTYLLAIEGADEDSNATGDLDLTSNIIIEVVSGTATLDGNQLDRVLHWAKKNSL
jgi:hypothetical protein